MVLVRFATAGLARGDDPGPIASRCMDDDEHPAESIQPERHESEFALGVRILSRATFGIAQSHLGLAERDPVLEQVAPCLRGVEFDEYR